MPTKRKATDPDAPPESSPPTQVVVKRQRVSRACDQCRAAREKCDGARPLCFPCVSQNRPCTYEVNPKKRGVQTGYIRTLELALAWVFEKVPGCEDTLDAYLGHEGGRGQNLLSGKDPSAANRLHKRWRRSKVQRGIERILSGADPSQLRTDKCSPSDDLSDSDGDADRTSISALRSETADGPLSFSPASLDNGHDSSTQAGRHPRTGEHAASGILTAPATSPSVSRAPPQTPSRSVHQLKLPSNHWRLLDIYFSYTHSWLPILEKQEIFQTSYLYSPDAALALPPNSASSAAHAELWSALALASFQDAASSGNVPLPSNPDDSGALTPTQIYDIARQLIPGEEGPFQVNHTRALLLLGLINLGRENLRPAWILVGLAIRIFLDVGVHSWPMSGRHQQRFHSVFIACFFLDTLLSERLGQPPHLKADDMMEALPISENDLDEWQPWVACEGFGQTSHMSRQSRSPPYSLSTFNQLYEIFKVVSRNLAVRNGEGGATEAGLAKSDLRQAISARAPFSPVVLSSELSSSAVPSPYLIKILFLWAGVVLDTDPGPGFRLIMDALEEHQSVFGTPAAPPFFASCLSSLANRYNVDALSQAERARFSSLKDRLVSVWTSTRGNHDSVVRNHSSLDHVSQAMFTPSDSHESSQQRAGSLVPHSVPTPSPFYLNASLPAHPTASDVPTYPPIGTPYVLSARQGSKSLLAPPTTALIHETTNVDRPMPANISAIDQSQPPQHMPLRGSFNGSSLDYDALLDDLASIDCVDRVDMDPQFMANLGFAPGCDLTDIMSHDFGAL